MPKRVTDYRQRLLESLTDPQEAAYYLEAALEDSNEMFLRALRDVAEARQMSSVAKEAGVAREALYRMLSDSGNPTFFSLSSILNVVGVRLKIAPTELKIAPTEIAPTEVDNPPSGRPSLTNEKTSAEAGTLTELGGIRSIGSRLQTEQQIATKLGFATAAHRKPAALETAIMGGHFDDNNIYARQLKPAG